MVRTTSFDNVDGVAIFTLTNTAYCCGLLKVDEFCGCFMHGVIEIFLSETNMKNNFLAPPKRETSVGKINLDLQSI